MGLTALEFIEQNPSLRKPSTDLHIENLNVLDARCALCRQGEGMLCNGYRQHFDPLLSQQYRAFKLSHESCEKLVDKTQKRMRKAAFENSYVPIEAIKQRRLAGNERTVLVGYEPPIKAYSQASHVITDVVFDYMVAMAAEFRKPKYIHPMQFLKHRQWTDMRLELMNCDWLVVERIDLDPGTNFEREALVEIINNRVNRGAPVLVTTGDNPLRLVKTDQEKDLYTEVLTWPKFNYPA